MSPTLQLLLAHAYERLGDERKATEHYRQSIRDAGLDRADLYCRSCDAKYPAWSARCEKCGSWGSIEVDLREETLVPAELGVRSMPVWAVYGEFEPSGP